jgi:hypothetical protein
VSGELLLHRVQDLLDQAAQVFRGHVRAEAWLRLHRERLAEPLRVAITGPPMSGKSMLVNALIGEDVAPVRADGAAVWFHDGARPLAHVFPEAAPPFVTPLERSPRGGHVIPSRGPARVVTEWPCRALRHTRLLDTTGDPTTDPAAGRAGGELPTAAEADVLLHVTRHLGDDDLAPLQAVRSGRGAGAYPVHVMVVLSRADEFAGGRTDALITAKRIARRRRRDPQVAALCQDVLALSGRMALAGRTLREDEYAAIATIAGLARADTDALLLSADRFTGGAFPVPVPAERRVALLDRLGLGGVRLATTLARTGTRSRAALGEQLVRQSGLTELQASISDLFTARRDVLKARSALLALDQLLRTEARPAAAYLIGEAERLVANAHEFRELRLLAALRTGRVALPAELAVEARRLAGGEGGAHCERLGVSPHAPAEELWPAAETAAARWHEQTTAAATVGGRRAAEVVLRSCTAILNDLG